MSGQPNHDTAEIMEVDTPPTTGAPEPEVTEFPTDKKSLVELSSIPIQKVARLTSAAQLSC